MATDVALECSCGAFAGVVRGVTRRNATRLSCMCDDCQVYAHYLGRAAAILDAHGGTDLSYATQARIRIERGHEQLSAMRLSESGMLRVYTGCCRTPVAHVPSPRLAFVGIPHLIMRLDVTRFDVTGLGEGLPTRDEVLGPLVHRLQGRFCRGDLPEGAELGTPLSLFLVGMTRMLWNSARGQHTPSPFHDAVSHAPVVVPHVLGASELDALRSLLPVHAPAPTKAHAGGALPQGCS